MSVYRVTADFRAASSSRNPWGQWATIQPLLGLNTGPLYEDDPHDDDPRLIDLTAAYGQIGISSVRVLDIGTQASNVFGRDSTRNAATWKVMFWYSWEPNDPVLPLDPTDRSDMVEFFDALYSYLSFLSQFSGALSGQQRAFLTLYDSLLPLNLSDGPEGYLADRVIEWFTNPDPYLLHFTFSGWDPDIPVFDPAWIESYVQRAAFEVLQPQNPENAQDLAQGFYLDAKDVCLFWNPTMARVQYGPLDDPADYDLTRTHVDQKWERLASSGLEIYYCPAEGWFGPRFFDPLVSILGAPDRTEWFEAYSAIVLQVLESLAATATNKPSFIELWNEPAGRYFWSPDGGDPVGIAEDFQLLLTEIRRKLADELDTSGWPASPALGGVAFTAGGLHELAKVLDQGVDPGEVKTAAMLDELLDSGELERFQFLSYHLYGHPLEDDDLANAFDRYAVEALDWAYDLVRASTLLSEYLAWRGALMDTNVPRHLTEWNLALMSDLVSQYPEGNPTHTSVGRGFASMALTLGHHPSLHLGRMHLFCGFEELGGLFYREAGFRQRTQGPADPDPFLTEFVDLQVRPAAFAFYLHAGLEGDRWIPVTIAKDVKRRTPRGKVHAETLSFDGVLDAATHFTEEGRDIASEDDAILITALATEAEQTMAGPVRRTVILTNLDRAEQTVELTVSGLSYGTSYRIVSRTPRDDSNMPAGGWVVPCTPSGWSNKRSVRRGTSPWSPDETELEQLFEDQLETVEWVQPADSCNGDLVTEVSIPARGLVRLDITEDTETQVMQVPDDSPVDLPNPAHPPDGSPTAGMPGARDPDERPQGTGQTSTYSEPREPE